jgi:hypothetical protein
MACVLVRAHAVVSLTGHRRLVAHMYRERRPFGALVESIARGSGSLGAGWLCAMDESGALRTPRREHRSVNARA